MHKDQRGFIALISAIIIAAMLLLMITSAAIVGIYSRTNILESELKDRSFAAAEGCADQALVKLSMDPFYTGGTFSINDLDSCRVGKVVSGASTYQFDVQATSSATAVTNLRVVVNKADFSVASWQEITNY